MDTEFLLGGAIAFLLALLGWSDQIRGIQEKTRQHEREFLRAYRAKLSWRDLRAIVRPSEESTPEERLLGVLRLLNKGGLQDGSHVSLLREFEALDRIREELEKAYTIRYWAISATVLEMLAAGSLSVYFRGSLVAGVPLTWEHLYFSLTIVLVAGIALLTAVTSLLESSFRRKLNEVEDQLRLSDEGTAVKE